MGTDLTEIKFNGENPPNIVYTPTIIVVLVAFAAVAVPRLMLLGGLPATDEGVYAYYAQIIHASLTAGNGLPDTGGLMLYSLLLNWVFAFDTNPLMTLRLVDMLVALGAGCILHRVIEMESRSRLGASLICLLFLFTMNQPVFIQYGFKNSMNAAYVPLFTALWLCGPCCTTYTARRWIGIGALLSVAILLRETFLPLMILGALAVLAGHGLRPFGCVMLGAFGTGTLITGAILTIRGGIVATLNSYLDAARIYASMADQRVELFFGSGALALNEAAVSLVVAGAGLIVTLACSISGRKLAHPLPRLAFWLAAVFIPLIEPASKIGFPYHFSVCLPGLAGLAALGWRNLCEGRSVFWPRLAACTLGIALLAAVIPRLMPLGANWPQTREALASFRSGQWPESFTNKTNYLLAAKAIRQGMPPSGTVAVGGYMYTLYPLTGFLPPKPEFANLTNTIIQLELSIPRLRAALLRCPPDVVMTTSRTDWPGGPEILAAVRETGIYKEIAEIPTTNDRAYGGFGGLVFRATKQFPCGSLAGYD